MAEIDRAAFTKSGDMIGPGRFWFEEGDQELLPKIDRHHWIAFNLKPGFWSSVNRSEKLVATPMAGHPSQEPSGFHDPSDSHLHLSLGNDISEGLTSFFQRSSLETSQEYSISSRAPAELHDYAGTSTGSGDHFTVQNSLLSCREYDTHYEIQFTGGPLVKQAPIGSDAEDILIESQIYLTFSVSRMTTRFRFGGGRDQSRPKNYQDRLPNFDPAGHIDQLDLRNILLGSSGQILAHDGSQIYECWLHKDLSSRRVSCMRYGESGLMDHPTVMGEVLEVSALSFHQITRQVSWSRDVKQCITGDGLGCFQHLSGYAAADNGGPVLRSIERISLHADLTRRGLKIELDCDLSAMQEGSGDIPPAGAGAMSLKRTLIFNWETLIARNLLPLELYRNRP